MEGSRLNGQIYYFIFLLEGTPRTGDLVTSLIVSPFSVTIDLLVVLVTVIGFLCNTNRDIILIKLISDYCFT